MYLPQESDDKRKGIAERLQQDEASSKGAIARTRGAWSGSNPYLDMDMLPLRTSQPHATWFSQCGAWWRGWNAEDALIRKRLQSCLPPPALSSAQSSS
jgi:hypothetical protein